MKDENRMFNPDTFEIRSAHPPADLVASVAAKNAVRLGFTDEQRSEAENRLKKAMDEINVEYQ